MGFYVGCVKMMMKSQLQYRLSFWLLVLGQFFIPLSVFAGMYFLFARFGTVQGWHFFEAALCFAVIHMAMAISECCARGFDAFSNLIVSGDFDRMMLRPRGTVVQVMGSDVDFSRIGRLLQSVCVLAWAVSSPDIHWTALKAGVLLLMIASGAFVFTGIFMANAALCFWTVQGVEVSHIFTDGGKELAQYPLDIYPQWIRRFFTLVIPFGCVNYWPMLFILDRTDGASAWYALMPLWGILFLLPCLWVWRLGVRHYQSTGS